MKNLIVLVSVLCLGWCAPAVYAQNAPKKVKSNPTSGQVKAGAPAKETVKSLGHAVKKHHKKRPIACTQKEEVIELENGHQTMVIEVKQGGLYINNDLVSTVGDARKECHKIIINIREDDTLEEKTVAVFDAEKPHTHRAILGVYTDPYGDANGARVSSVVSNGPADDAGIRKGDLITKIGNKPINSSKDLIETIEDHNGGEKVRVTLERDGKEMEVVALLADKITHKRHETYDYSVPDLHATFRMPQAFIHSYKYLGEDNSFEYTPEMGISGKTDNEERGVKVLDVKPNSPAYDAGIEPGDIIIRVDNFRTATVDDLRDVLDDVWLHQTVNVKLIRKGDTKIARLHFSTEHSKRDF